MSEVTARLAVYGAIDRAVEENPDLRASASRLLAPYGLSDDGFETDVVGWYDRLSSMFGFPALDVETAVAEWSQTTPANPLDAADRLYALYALANLRPDDPLIGVEQIADAVSTVVEGDDPDLVAANAAQLAQLLAPSDDESPGLADGDNDDISPPAFGEIVSDARANGLISTEVSIYSNVPCKIEFREIMVGATPVKAGRFVTQMWVPARGRSLAALDGYLDPAKWAKCYPSFWCAMDEINPVSTKSSTRSFKEVVGACPDPWFEVRLTFDELPATTAERSMYYDLCAGYQPKAIAQHPAIVHDSGTIVASFEDRGAGAGLELGVATEKVLAFDTDDAGLFLLACAAGYGQNAQQVVYMCAHLIP